MKRVGLALLLLLFVGGCGPTRDPKAEYWRGFAAAHRKGADDRAEELQDEAYAAKKAGDLPKTGRLLAEALGEIQREREAQAAAVEELNPPQEYRRFHKEYLASYRSYIAQIAKYREKLAAADFSELGGMNPYFQKQKADDEKRLAPYRKEIDRYEPNLYNDLTGKPR
ncbi:hypothetical protein EON81_05700 [bacterium]|nr:MAG: hypothetical protein EON81_05700 [bacterium]